VLPAVKTQGAYMTERVFLADAYVRQCKAEIVSVEDTAIRLNRTVFYPLGGGQPGDTGHLTLEGGRAIPIFDTRNDTERVEVLHFAGVPVAGDLIGEQVTAVIDWERRYALMRIHTLLHLLCSLVPAGVTGGSVREGSGRLDFDLPGSTLDKGRLTRDLNRLIQENHAVSSRWITDAELAATPGLVRTMSVQPPTGRGQVRLLEIDDVDVQPCGGTHVAGTGEIGPVRVTKIEKKGRHNRRVTVAFT